jgi:hypothetical protein
MKKILLAGLLLTILFPLFSQTASDYFPAKEGYRWEYIGSNGKVTDIYTCLAIETSNNFYLVGFSINSLGITTKPMYRVVEDAAVFEIGKIDMNGNRTLFLDEPFVILSLKDVKWREEDRGDVFLCQSKKTGVSFDGKSYNDCIMVEKAIYIDERPLMVKRQYFARGIGLVYVTLQGQDGVEKPHLRLASYKF